MLARLQHGGGGMDPKDVFSLGLGLNEPWKLAGHRLDIEKRPHELHLEVVADRGALFSCPDCKRACKAHDFESFTWRHLNFFQHHCFIMARVPRVDCPDHGVKRVTVPWARSGSRFTLLFEQAALILAREMPVAAAARFVGIADKRLWRVLQYYVARAVGTLDLGSARAHVPSPRWRSCRSGVGLSRLICKVTRSRCNERSVSSRLPANSIPLVRTVTGAAAAHAARISPISGSINGSPPVTKISLTPSSAASMAIRRTRSIPRARRGALGDERTQQ